MVYVQIKYLYSEFPLHEHQHVIFKMLQPYTKKGRDMNTDDYLISMELADKVRAKQNDYCRYNYVRKKRNTFSL